jgi:hypothetical protein
VSKTSIRSHAHHAAAISGALGSTSLPDPWSP